MHGHKIRCPLPATPLGSACTPFATLTLLKTTANNCPTTNNKRKQTQTTTNNYQQPLTTVGPPPAHLLGLHFDLGQQLPCNDQGQAQGVSGLCCLLQHLH